MTELPSAGCLRHEYEECLRRPYLSCSYSVVGGTHHRSLASASLFKIDENDKRSVSGAGRQNFVRWTR